METEETRILRDALLKIERLTDEPNKETVEQIRYAAAYGLEFARAARKKAERKVTIQ